jgi:hypothetical protein
MADVIHEHQTTTDSGSGMGFLLGVIMLIVFAFLLFYYGLPALRSASSGPTVNVPGKIDVNVNQPAAK